VEGQAARTRLARLCVRTWGSSQRHRLRSPATLPPVAGAGCTRACTPQVCTVRTGHATRNGSESLTLTPARARDERRPRQPARVRSQGAVEQHVLEPYVVAEVLQVPQVPHTRAGVRAHAGRGVRGHVERGCVALRSGGEKAGDATAAGDGLQAVTPRRRAFGGSGRGRSRTPRSYVHARWSPVTQHAQPVHVLRRHRLLEPSNAVPSQLLSPDGSPLARPGHVRVDEQLGVADGRTRGAGTRLVAVRLAAALHLHLRHPVGEPSGQLPLQSRQRRGGDAATAVDRDGGPVARQQRGERQLEQPGLEVP
jgi:hypothetical protein